MGRARTISAYWSVPKIHLSVCDAQTLNLVFVLASVPKIICLQNHKRTSDSDSGGAIIFEADDESQFPSPRCVLLSSATLSREESLFCDESLARDSSREESLARSLLWGGVSREESPLSRSQSQGDSPREESLASPLARRLSCEESSLALKESLTKSLSRESHLARSLSRRVSSRESLARSLSFARSLSREIPLARRLSRGVSREGSPLARSLLRGVSSGEESLARSLLWRGVSREETPLARSLSRVLSRGVSLAKSHLSR